VQERGEGLFLLHDLAAALPCNRLLSAFRIRFAGNENNDGGKVLVMLVVVVMMEVVVVVAGIYYRNAVMVFVCQQSSTAVAAPTGRRPSGYKGRWEPAKNGYFLVA
jgi:hypothetical protein